MSENILIQFENRIRKALADFNRRLEQQRSFQIQNKLLKQLSEEIKTLGYCDSKEVELLSLEYEGFYKELSGSGRTYENIVDEKNLVDTYSAFEKFLFDCFYSLYISFPKFLSKDSEIKVNISDLFIDEDIELCKRNIVESKVKSFIQAKNIIEILNGFNKDFDIKEIKLEKNDLDNLYQIALVRNLIIHNNSVVNRIYKEQINKFLKNKEDRYPFNEREPVFSHLPNLVDDMKTISARVCEKIASALINEGNRLKNHHEQMN